MCNTKQLHRKLVEWLGLRKTNPPFSSQYDNISQIICVLNMQMHLLGGILWYFSLSWCWTKILLGFKMVIFSLANAPLHIKAVSGKCQAAQKCKHVEAFHRVHGLNLVWFCLILVNSLFPHVRWRAILPIIQCHLPLNTASWWDHPHRTLQFALFDVCSDNGMLEIRQLWSSNSVLIKRPLSFNQTILLLMWQHCFKLVLSVCCQNKRGTKCVTLCDYVPEKNESNICSYAFCQVANL